MESSKNQPEPEKLYIRPADKSLAAYKGFILDMQEHLTGDRNDSMSEEEWVDSWREFWEGGI